MKLPLRITRSGESVRIEDAGGRAIYLYFEDEATRRGVMKRWTSDEAEALAKRIARLLTDEKAGATPKDDAGQV